MGFLPTQQSIHTHTHTHTRAHAHSHTRTHTRTYSHTHTHTHSHTLTITSVSTRMICTSHITGFVIAVKQMKFAHMEYILSLMCQHWLNVSY